jgi:hypothetical protein
MNLEKSGSVLLPFLLSGINATDNGPSLGNVKGGCVSVANSWLWGSYGAHLCTAGARRGDAMKSSTGANARCLRSTIDWVKVPE